MIDPQFRTLSDGAIYVCVGPCCCIVSSWHLAEAKVPYLRGLYDDIRKAQESPSSPAHALEGYY